VSDDLRRNPFAPLSEAVPLTAAPYAVAIGESLQRSHYDLATRWLERLVAILPIDPQAIFSSDLLLDHIPALIQEVGKYVAAPAEEDIAAKAMVVDKARELGQLRHRQQASVHQVLREYDLLGDILEQFVIDETRAYPGGVTAVDSLEICRRLNRAVRVLMQITAATFIAEYTETITEQATRLDRFNRAVSHELRNVLGTLQFGAELLGERFVSDDPARRQHIVGTVRRSTERALRIVRSFERLPRSGIMKDSPSEQIVELAELVQEVFRQLREMADSRGVELRTSGDFPQLFLDTGALELVLINLISNALKYSDPAKDTKYVNVAGASRESQYEIRIEDNGIGIPADAAVTVFQRFTRAHAELDEQLGVDGTGLGLSIVEECVKALGGDIRLESVDGTGTTFLVTLPKKLPPLPPPDHPV
jgi:signal transduction histidine kinase